MTGPGSEPWEVYTVKDDARADLEGKTSLDLSDVSGDGTCCATDATADGQRRDQGAADRRGLLLKGEPPCTPTCPA